MNSHKYYRRMMQDSLQEIRGKDNTSTFLHKAPIEYSPEPNGISTHPIKNPNENWTQIHQQELPNGLVYKQFKRDDAFEHHIVDPSTNASVSVLHTRAVGHPDYSRPQEHKITWSQTDPSQKNKGLGRQAYLAALVHGKGVTQLNSGTELSLKGHQAWSGLKNVSGLKVNLSPYATDNVAQLDLEAYNRAASQHHTMRIANPQELNHESMFPKVDLGQKEEKLASSEEAVKGGKGDYKRDSEFSPKEIKMGHKVEREHTNSPKVAAEITRDHLTENPKYYSKLKQAGLADELQKAEPPPSHEGEISRDGKKVAVQIPNQIVWDMHPKLKAQRDAQTLDAARQWIQTQPTEHHSILKQFINNSLKDPYRHIRYGSNEKDGPLAVRLRHIHQMVTNDPETKLVVHSPESLSLYVGRHGEAGGITHFKYNLKKDIAKSENLYYNGIYGNYTDSIGNRYKFFDRDGRTMSKSERDALGTENGLLRQFRRLTKADETTIRSISELLRYSDVFGIAGSRGNEESYGAPQRGGASLLKSEIAKKTIPEVVSHKEVLDHVARTNPHEPKSPRDALWHARPDEDRIWHKTQIPIERFNFNIKQNPPHSKRDVKKYTNKILSGSPIPRAVVTGSYMGNELHPVSIEDGRHRIAAAMAAGETHIPVYFGMLPDQHKEFFNKKPIKKSEMNSKKYSLKYHAPKGQGAYGLHTVTAHDHKGNVVGELSAEDLGDGTFQANMVEVHPEHRRKGIAGAMYDHMQNKTNLKAIPDLEAQTSDASKFWANRKRLGKAESKKQPHPYNVGDRLVEKISENSNLNRSPTRGVVTAIKTDKGRHMIKLKQDDVGEHEYKKVGHGGKYDLWQHAGYFEHENNVNKAENHSYEILQKASASKKLLGMLGLAAATAVPMTQPDVKSTFSPKEAYVSHQPTKKDIDLRSIAEVESRGGKDTKHKVITTGLNAGSRAVGSFGLMPLTIKDIVSKNPALKSKYGATLGHSDSQLHSYMLKNPQFEKDVASAHYDNLNRTFKGNLNHIAHAWLNGKQGTLNAIKSGKPIENHWHVKKVANARNKILGLKDQNENKPKQAPKQAPKRIIMP